MRSLFLLLVLVLPACSTTAAAETDLPGEADWYLHIDFDEMRNEEAGSPVYHWLQAEVFADVEEDAGIDLDEELDSLTAFSVASQGPIVVLRGNISQGTRDKVMALLAADGSIGPQKAAGKRYFRFGSDYTGENRVLLNESEDLGMAIALEEGAWISVDVKDMVLITATEDQMTQLLANDGKVAATGKRNGALFVLTAEKTLLQAGMDSDAIDAGWESNILQNAEQVAFLIAAARDKLAIEARLITSDAEMAESLASVARGLISLMSFDDSMDPESVAMLQSTRIAADDTTLSLSLAIDARKLVEILDD